MNPVRRIHPFCGIFWGIATILLLICGQDAPARSPALEGFTPTVAARALLAPPPPALPSAHWETSSVDAPQQAALSRDRLPSPLLVLARAALPIRFYVQIPLPRENRHIPGLLEIRACCPFPSLLPRSRPEPVSLVGKRVPKPARSPSEFISGMNEASSPFRNTRSIV